jgi:hypothetical protein
MLPECALNNPGIRRLVMSTLVFGTLVGKLYCLVNLGTFFNCFLQLECWNVGPRASAST